MELSLYMPIANQTRFKTKYSSLGICKSSPSGWNIVCMLVMACSGDKMAVDVTEMEKMLRPLPDMYIMKAFIAICWPGAMAMDMAFCFFFRVSAVCCA